MSKFVRNTEHTSFSVLVDQLAQMQKIREVEGLPHALQIRQALKLWFSSREINPGDVNTRTISTTIHASFSVSKLQLSQMKNIRENENIPCSVQLRQALSMWFAGRKSSI